MPDKKYREAIYRWRVRFSLFVLLAVIALARPALTPVLIGLVICAIGLLVRAWAAGHIKKEKELAVSGPYQYTRNPLYLGNFILGLSIAIGTNSWWCLGLTAGYFLVFYPPIIREERERMKRLFPKEYEEYKRNVPLFLPTRKPLNSSNGARFSWTLYRKNREFRALLGSVIVWLVLIAKMLILS